MSDKPIVQEFLRYEFKYILSQEIRDKVEKEIGHFMNYDGYIHDELDNAYFVRSLYFDGPNSFNFYEKIDGIKKRKKFRLRTYSREAGQSPVFIEQKGRNENRVFKYRSKIKSNKYETFLSNQSFDFLAENYDVKIVKEFLLDRVKRNISPVVLVDYVRTPYVSDYDMNFRVTFDSKIRAKSTNSLFPEDDFFFDCLSGYTILEIKFFRKIPAWFHKIILVYDLERVSVSKFVLGMKATGVAIDLS